MGGIRYNPALDGLRAIAVLVVVAHHAGVPWLYGGYLGVDVFFVLSGYLITSILDAQARSGGVALGAFYLRRARRLYPALCVLTFGLLALSVIGPRDALVMLLYLSDYGAAWFDVPVDAVKHTWSLAVEEHFYVLWPFAVMGLAKLSKPRAALVLAVAYLAAALWRIHQLDPLSYYRADAHCAGLILGALLAYLPSLNLRWGWIATLMLYVAYDAAGRAGRMAPVELATAAVILWSVSGRIPALEWSPLRYLGRISYGIYLFHQPIVYAMNGRPWPEVALLTLVGSVTLAVVSYHVVEVRFQSEPRRRPQRGVADAVA